MKYKFFTTSEKAWAAMLESIVEAERSIYLESFILTDDDVTHHFFEILKQKAREGVSVKIIIDTVGHFWYGSVNKKEFEEAGAEVLFFNRWLYRSHRKVLIVDEKTAFLGGVNVRGEYAKWLDLHVRIGGLLVKRLLHSFSRVYALSGGRDNSVLGLRKNLELPKARRAIYKAKSWLIERWPIKGSSALQEYYKKKCAQAKRSIVVVTPYFIPHKWLISSLKMAADRGVGVEVIVPQKTDTWIADVAHRVFAQDLSFIKFFFLKKMNHAKVLLVDDAEGMVGSNNIDAQSFDFNLEASVVFNQKNMIGDLKGIIKEWKDGAAPLDLGVAGKRSWYYAVIGWFIKLVQPIL